MKAKSVLIGKCIMKEAFQETRKIPNKQPKLALKGTRKRQTKPELSRNKEIKIREKNK